MNNAQKLRTFMFVMIGAGALSIAHALWYLEFGQVDVYLVVLAILTLGIGSRITIPIPRFKSHISVSDTFVFLALFMYGGEVAILLAAAEAFVSSWRFCNKKITVITNAGAMAICTTIVAHAMEWSGLLADVKSFIDTRNLNSVVIALSVLALLQFACNTTFAAFYGSFKSAEPVWKTWKKNFLWSFVTYAVGSVAAGLLYVLNGLVGFAVVVATFPIAFLVYLSYKMYLENVEMSMHQAEQAKEHAAVLEEQSSALRESEERFRSAFDYAPIGIAMVSATGRWLKVNRALTEILGYTTEEFLESDFQSMTFAKDLGEALVMIHELHSGRNQTCQREQRFIHKDGRLVWTYWSASPVENVDEDKRHLIFQIQDIEDKKRAEEKLQYEATHDSLTGLPNRSHFLSRLDAAIETAQRNPSFEVSVLFIDLDRFKVVNDSLGHLVGDQLLIAIARRLKDCLRPSDLVARLGGDEFVILVEGKGESANVIQIAERVQEKFSSPFELDGREIYSSASIGILNLGENHFSAEDMMRDADTAMYHAKRAGKARHEVFDPKMHEVAKAALQIETDMRRAVENREFTVAYQPIYSIRNDETIGFEALARWQHIDRGFIPPDEFIPIAEELGLIHELGEQILKMACRDMRALIEERGTDAPPLILSVNVSSRQFANPEFVNTVRSVILETGFPPA